MSETWKQQIIERVGKGDQSAPVRITVEVDAPADLAAGIQHDVVDGIQRTRHWGSRVVENPPVAGRPERVIEPAPVSGRVDDLVITATLPPGVVLTATNCITSAGCDGFVPPHAQNNQHRL